MTSEFEPETGIPWHALPLDEVYEKLSSGPEGLGDDEATHRLQHYGPNTLPARKPPGIISIFLHQFGSPLMETPLTPVPPEVLT